MVINLRGVKESGTHLRGPDLLLHRRDVRHRRASALVRLSTGTLGRVLDPPPLESHRRDCRRVTALPAPARLLQRHHRPHRRGGHLQRHHRLQGAAQPQRRASRSSGCPCILATLFLGITYLARPDRRRALGGGDGDLAARAHRLRRPRAALPRRHRRHHPHPDDGRQHRLRGLPAPLRAAGRGRLPAPAAHLPRQPARVLARHHRPGRHRLRSSSWSSRRASRRSSRSTRSACSCPSPCPRRA